MSLTAGAHGPRTAAERARARAEVEARRLAALRIQRQFLEDVSRRRGEIVTGHERTAVRIGRKVFVLPSRTRELVEDIRSATPAERKDIIAGATALADLSKFMAKEFPARPVKVKAHLREGKPVEAHERAAPGTTVRGAVTAMPGERIDPELMERLRRRRNGR